MSIGTLYVGAPQQGKALRIKAVAAVAGLTLDEPSGYVHKTTNRTPQFIAKFASGKVPAFESKDGFTLFEATAIARYLASLAPNTTLLGSSLQEAALVDQWNSFFDSEIDELIRHVRAMLRGVTPYNKAHDQAIRERLVRPLETVENHLAKHTFLVGERLSLADITAASVLGGAYTSILGKAERAKYPHTIRYYETVVNQPKVKDVLDGAQFVETAKQYVPPQKEQKPKAEKPKA